MQNTTEENPVSPSRLERTQRRAATRFPSLWSSLLQEWNAPEGADRLCLMYSSSYLLRTAGLRWALDPVRLAHRLPGAPQMDWAAGLQGLSLVALTHRHEDHLDPGLIHCLRALPVTWLVPEAILRQVQEAGIPRSRIVVPRMLEPLRFQGLQLTAFEGLHWERSRGALKGVPAVGYLAEFGGRRWLFPGDTREYDAGRLPDFGGVDGLVAHLWLGRGCAQMDRPPLFGDFLSFCLALRPGRILLTHLNEWGRGPEDLWELHHAVMARRAFHRLDPSLAVRPLLMGQCAPL